MSLNILVKNIEKQFKILNELKEEMDVISSPIAKKAIEKEIISAYFNMRKVGFDVVNFAKEELVKRGIDLDAKKKKRN